MSAAPNYTTQEATDAIKAIGTKALPTFLTWLRYEQSPAKRWVIELIYRLPLGKRKHDLWLALGGPKISLLPKQADEGFRILGADAQSAIPELVRLAKDPRHPRPSFRAIKALGRIGPLSMPELAKLLSDTSCPNREAVVVQIANFATNVPSAVPMILQLTSNPAEDLSSAAVSILGTRQVPYELAVPALINGLGSKHPKTQQFAAASLGQYTTQAVQAAPALRQLLFASNLFTRYEATNALLKIQPEGFTKTRLQ
jgi:hypothetical protein